MTDGCCFQDEDVQAVIIDNGSHTIKAGFAGNDAPHVVIPAKSGHPITNDAITNWEGLETLWGDVFKQLDVDPSGHPVLFTVGYLISKADQEKMIKIMFEKFNVPALFVSIPAHFSLHAAQKTTGVVVDVGESHLSVVPIHEGNPVPHALASGKASGRALTNYLQELLGKESHKFTSSELSKTEEIKEKACYLATDFDKEVATLSQGKASSLPGASRVEAPEALFNPSPLGKGSISIEEAINSAIKKCDSNLHKDLYGNILLAGGTTTFNNFSDRLQKALEKSASHRVRVTAPPERKYSAWIGASELASLSDFQMRWFSKEEYDDNASIAQEKCPHYDGA
ncbi:Actin [Cladobotryum mycophilum]|uniref:Actin n=1 Tax=Cladobotryum mycophilum TaxID=491253 RepID=A0ABR0SR32_9HYPO